MAQLAIKGHKKRGKEVIEILAMLGGSNVFGHEGNNPLSVYYVNESYKDYIICSNGDNIPDYVIFTLEEFLEKFPYKVGDKVVVKGLSEYPKSIHFMKWFDDNIHYSFDNETWFLPSALKTYKEETMKENLTIQDIRDSNAEWLYWGIGINFYKEL